MSNRTEDFDPMGNDEWFERHVVPHINKIEKNNDGIYIIPISQHWERHPYHDDYSGKVELAIFPKKVFTAQKWGPNFGQAVRFFKTLKAKLDSFKDKPDELQRVDIRLYLSGASGPRRAILNAWEDSYPRQGLPFFKTPITWSLIPMNFNWETKKYEEEPLLSSYPIRDED
jgi:hypothetical protein